MDLPTSPEGEMDHTIPNAPRQEGRTTDSSLPPPSPASMVGSDTRAAKRCNDEPGRTVPPPDPWQRYRWTAPLALIACSLVVALAWDASPSSRDNGSALAGDGSPSVVAGEPTAAMVQAVDEIGSQAPDMSPVLEVRTEDPAADAATVATGSGDIRPDTDGSVGPDPATPPASTSGTDTATVGSSAAEASPNAGTTIPEPPGQPIRVFPVHHTDRLTTAKLVTLIEDQNITNVADFLSALPPFMGESFTLMERSRSRHLASTEYPRLIMYGPDARLLIGVSSHPSDPLREVVELAELDEGTGLWRFSQLDFRATFVHDTATESCAGCHGSPQRPIWGEYPDWNGAFAGDDERLTGGQVASLMKLKSDPIDRFHHLVFPSDHSIQSNGQLYLPSRQYGYANTSFNFELNAAVADGLARRLLAHPDWERNGHRLMAAQWRCGSGYDAAELDALYNRFGIDGTNDFQLESPVFEATTDQRAENDWNQGSTGLDDSVAFRTLDLAADQDPTLRAIVASDPIFERLSSAWFDVLGAERAEFLRVNGIYDIDFRPQNLGGAFVSRVCDHLASKED